MLPFVTKTAQPLKNTAYPKNLTSLGNHIRKKRLELELQQKEVAKSLNVTKETIWNWENNRNEPDIKYYPAIMGFLGYCPYVKPQTWGEKLKFHRIYQGLTIKQVGKIINSDPASIARWEKMEAPPIWRSQSKKIKRFMAKSFSDYVQSEVIFFE